MHLTLELFKNLIKTELETYSLEELIVQSLIIQLPTV